MKNLKKKSPIHPTPKGSELSWEFFRKPILLHDIFYLTIYFLKVYFIINIKNK